MRDAEGGVTATAALPPSLAEHNEELKPLLYLVADVLAVLEARGPDDVWSRGMRVMEPFFEAFQQVFEDVQLAQSGLVSVSLTPGEGVLPQTTTMSDAGIASWVGEMDLDDKATPVYPTFLHTALAVHEYLTSSEEVHATLKPIMDATRALSRDDAASFAGLYVRYVDAMATHVAAFLHQKHNIDMLQLVSTLRRDGSGGSGGDGGGGSGVAPLLGVTIFVTEAFAALDGGTLGSSGDVGALFSGPLSFVPSNLSCASEDDAADADATRAALDEALADGMGGAMAIGPDAWSPGAGAAAADDDKPMPAVEIAMAKEFIVGSWLLDVERSEPNAAVAIYDHLGCKSRIASKALAYITASIKVSMMARDGRPKLRVRFRALASFAKHSLFFMELDLTNREIEPRLRGRVLTRHWWVVGARGEGLQCWFEMFGTQCQRIVRTCFSLSAADHNSMLVTAYLLSPTEDGASWQFVKQTVRVYSRVA